MAETDKKPREKIVPAPRGFSREEKILWGKLQRAARAQGTWEDTDAVFLERLVNAASTAKLLREELKDKKTVTGSKGQEVAHPLFAEASKCDDTVLKYATVLLLTPQSRQRAGIGDAAPPDPNDPFAGVV